MGATHFSGPVESTGGFTGKNAGTVIADSTTTSSGPGAVAITGAIHEITTTGLGDALTLADGAEGQHLFIVYAVEGGAPDSADLTPVNLAGFETVITFQDIGAAAHLLFTAGDWYYLGGTVTLA